MVVLIDRNMFATENVTADVVDIAYVDNGEVGCFRFEKFGELFAGYARQIGDGVHGHSAIKIVTGKVRCSLAGSDFDAEVFQPSARYLDSHRLDESKSLVEYFVAPVPVAVNETVLKVVTSSYGNAMISGTQSTYSSLDKRTFHEMI
jgi:hypothetical protein